MTTTVVLPAWSGAPSFDENGASTLTTAPDGAMVARAGGAVLRWPLHGRSVDALTSDAPATYRLLAIDGRALYEGAGGVLVATIDAVAVLEVHVPQGGRVTSIVIE